MTIANALANSSLVTVLGEHTLNIPLNSLFDINHSIILGISLCEIQDTIGFLSVKYPFK
jgi:hypothetical protein